jgi:hypothetical protein
MERKRNRNVSDVAGHKPGDAQVPIYFALNGFELPTLSLFSISRTKRAAWLSKPQSCNTGEESPRHLP